MFLFLFHLISFFSFTIVSANDYVVISDTSATATWEDAESHCQSQYNTSLATITRPSDTIAIRNARQTAGIDDQTTWIGLSGFAVNNTWEWADGTGFANDIYTEWNGSQLNTSTTGRDFMAIDNNGEWISIDVASGVEHYFVCNHPQYIFVDNKQLNWTAAQDYCESEYNSSLATINNKDSNRIAFETIESELGGSVSFRRIWIGLNFSTYVHRALSYKNTNLDYSWSDGSQLIWAYWKPGSLGNTTRSYDQCGIFKIGTNDNDTWNTADCRDEFSFICNGNHTGGSDFTTTTTTTNTRMCLYFVFRDCFMWL